MVAIPTKVIALFEMLGLLALFETFDTIEDALKSFTAVEDVTTITFSGSGLVRVLHFSEGKIGIGEKRPTVHNLGKTTTNFQTHGGRRWNLPQRSWNY
jgi:hypothetical protein